jgi:hypothetical protein
MSHQVALTAPDPDLNVDARDFFTRHMRILEKCMEAWPMPDMKRQVDEMREAFSADTRKPFALKPSFPYGSPQSSLRSSPPGSVTAAFCPTLPSGRSMDQHLDAQAAEQGSHMSYPGHPITPPISAGPADNTGGSPTAVQPLVLIGQDGQAPVMRQTMPIADTPAWNPSRIFE